MAWQSDRSHYLASGPAIAIRDFEIPRQVHSRCLAGLLSAVAIFVFHRESIGVSPPPTLAGLAAVAASFGNVVDETHYNASGTAVSPGNAGYLDLAFSYTGKYFD